MLRPARTSGRRAALARRGLIFVAFGLVGFLAGRGSSQDQPPAPPKAPPMADHDDLFFTAPPQAQATVFLAADDRYKEEPIATSPRDAPWGRVLIREGDEAVGNAREVVADNLARFSALARLVDLENPEVKGRLQAGRMELIKAIRAVNVGPQDEAVRQEMADRRIGEFINNLVRMVTQLEGQTTLFSPELVEAVRVVRENPRASGLGIIGDRYRWPGGIIPYVIRVRGVPIAEAIAHWNEKSDRVRLRPVRQGDVAWLEFVAGAGCQSYIGKVVPQGPQYVMLAGGCAFDQCVHEIGHAVGLFHEQSRLDRDRFLSIQPHNAMAGTEGNFQQVRVGEAQDLGPFDFDSVMLYGPSAFSATGSPTMVARDPRRGMNWGINHRQLRGLSKGDVDAVASMYREPARAEP